MTAVVPCHLEAAEKVVLNISLNGEPKGDFFVVLAGDGDILIRPEDLKSLGVREVQGRTVAFDNEQYLSLKSIEPLAFSLDEKKLALAITARPQFLEKRSVIDLTPQLRRNVYYPRERSAFLNYGLTYSRFDPFGKYAFSVNNKLGIRSGDLLFLSDSTYTKTRDDSRFVRLMSNVTYEVRPELLRMVAGDSFASSGDLGSTINIGGLGISKAYQMNPSFIRHPMLDFSGVVATPSEAEIYLDGVLLRREKLQPGEFELKNLDYYGGVRTAEVVIKDAFGNMQRISRSLYFTDLLLQQGLHEYSYNLGFLREQFGSASNEYGDPAFSAFHRYGVRNDLNLGFRAEATKHRYNAGPQAACLIPSAGVVTLSLSGSSASGAKTGHADSLSYSYQNRQFGASLFRRTYSETYATIGGASAPQKVRTQAGLGASYGTPDWGSLSVDHTATTFYAGQGNRTSAATYSRSLFRNVSAYVSFRNVREGENRHEILFGLTWIPDRDMAVLARHQSTHDARTDTLQVQKNILAAEGVGYRAVVENTRQGSISSDTVSPFLQYNARHGIYSAEYVGTKRDGTSNNSYTLTASGAVVYADDTVGLTRPVNDSFSIVKVDNLPGALVKVNNLEIGKTDSSGTIIIPELRSYNNNQISLDAKDLPMDYHLSDTDIYVSPSAWAGSCLVFDVARLQAITGKLYGTKGGKRVPLEYYEVVMTVGNREIKFMTGSDGEFYFENIPPEDRKEGLADKHSCRSFSEEKASGGKSIKPGKYQARTEYNGKQCFFEIVVPETADGMIDVGTVECDSSPLSEPAPQVREVPLPAVPQSQAGALSPSPPAPAPPVPLAVAAPDIFVLHLPAGKAGDPAGVKFRKDVQTIARLLRLKPDLRVRIEGYGGTAGPDAANKKMASRRALAVKKQLLRSGVEETRIIGVEALSNPPSTYEDPLKPCVSDRGGVVVRLVPGDDRSAP